MNKLFKDFIDSDPVMQSIQQRADAEGLATNTNMHNGDLLTIMYAAMRRAFRAGGERFKPLFDQDARLNLSGQILYQKLGAVIDPITRGFVRDGFSPREVGHIVQMCAVDVELEGVLNLSPAPIEKTPGSPGNTEAQAKTVPPAEIDSEKHRLAPDPVTVQFPPA